MWVSVIGRPDGGYGKAGLNKNAWWDGLPIGFWSPNNHEDTGLGVPKFETIVIPHHCWFWTVFPSVFMGFTFNLGKL